MRKQIADILKQSRQYSCNTEFAPLPFNDKPYDPSMINVVFPDKILTLISEEIEKVENPYMEQTRDGECNIYPDFGIFEECRQKILAMFK